MNQKRNEDMSKDKVEKDKAEKDKNGKTESAPLVSQAVTRAIVQQCENVSGVIKSLAHPVRLKILCQLIEGEKTVNELTEFCDISQSAMSQFLGRMKSENMLKSRREGHFVYYSVSDAKLVRLLKAIKEIYC